MENWIFIFLMNLLIPLMMIGFGKLFRDNPPSEINGIYGYRTPMSTKNKDTWDFAHKYCGTLWLKYGKILLVLSIIPMLLVINQGIEVVGSLGGALTMVQLVILLFTIYPTEKALRKTFDKNGKRK